MLFRQGQKRLVNTYFIKIKRSTFRLKHLYMSQQFNFT